jgi:hypothetical protein
MHRGFRSPGSTSGVLCQGAIKKGMTGRSTPQNEEIKRTMEDTGTAENNSQIRRKGDPSDALMT